MTQTLSQLRIKARIAKRIKLETRNAELEAAVADVRAYLAMIDAMQPDKNHGTEGRRIRALLAQVKE